MMAGRHFRTHPEGTAFYLKVTDFDQDFQLKGDIEPSILEEKQYMKFWLGTGDMMVVIKGPNYFAHVYKNAVHPAIASSAFATLKELDVAVLLPEYLAWFINHSRTQAQLKASAVGTNIPSISLKTLGELEIPLPPMERQKNIVNLDSLFRKERRLRGQLSSLKETLFKEQLYKTL